MCVFLAHRLFSDLLPLLSKQWENVNFLVMRTHTMNDSSQVADDSKPNMVEFRDIRVNYVNGKHPV